MPVYAALSDLLERFAEAELIQLTDDAGTGLVDATRVDRALVAADGTIEGYLAARYTLPLARIPALLVGVACDIARFRLYRSSPTDSVEKANTAALKTLREISTGVIKIDAGVEEQTARPGAIIYDGSDPLFTRDKMKGF